MPFYEIPYFFLRRIPRRVLSSDSSYFSSTLPCARVFFGKFTCAWHAGAPGGPVLKGLWNCTHTHPGQ